MTLKIKINPFFTNDCFKFFFGYIKSKFFISNYKKLEMNVFFSCFYIYLKKDLKKLIFF